MKELCGVTEIAGSGPLDLGLKTSHNDPVPFAAMPGGVGCKVQFTAAPFIQQRLNASNLSTELVL